MSLKLKVSKEGKKFRDQYIIGNEYLPHIAAGLWLIREHRARGVTYNEVQALFEEEKYFFSAGTGKSDEIDLSVGKGNSMYVSLNRNMPIIPLKPIPTHSVIKSTEDSNYIQYVMRNTPLFAQVKYENSAVQLPDGLDIMELPDETLFQTQMCIDSRLTDGAATWMGLRDAEYKLGEMIYYGQSLLQIKRLDTAIMNVNKKLAEMMEITKHK
jgi:hypothetical protein